MCFYVCVLLLLLFDTSALTLQTEPLSKFTFSHSQTRRSGDCNVCFGGQCLSLEESRCDYYVEADALMPRDDEPQGFENPELRSDVDSILFDMVEKADLTFNLDCIPYVSRYTDCTKENICLGCKTCHCDSEGRWNCSSSNTCQQFSPAIDVDHKVLVSTLENLLGNITSMREKRSLTTKLDDLDNELNAITNEKLSAWLVGVGPAKHNIYGMLDTEISTTTENYTTLTENTSARRNNTSGTKNTAAAQNVSSNFTSPIKQNVKDIQATTDTAPTQNDDTKATGNTAAMQSVSPNGAQIKLTSFREKRSVSSNLFDESKPSTITMAELSAWLFGLEADKIFLKDEPTTENSVATQFYTTQIALEPRTRQTSKVMEAFAATETSIKNEPDYLGFDEVLNNIAIDTKNYTRRKSLSDLESLDKVDIGSYNNTNDFDYMLVDDEKPNNDSLNNATEMPYFVDFVTEVNVITALSENTTNLIDLLANANNDDIFNETVFKDENTNKDDIFIVGFDSNNNVLDYNSINLMKRDVSAVAETTSTPNVSSAIEVKLINISNIETSSANNTNLKQDVLLPLVKIINSKQNDILELTKIKQNLINFMNIHNQSPVVEIIDYPNVSSSNTLHDLEMFPELGFDLRRVNTNITEKMYLKTKSDVYEVIKDILKLRRYQKGNIPDDLNLLLYNLRRYLTQNRVHKRKFKTRMSNVFRRHWNTISSKCSEATFKNCIVEILEAIDDDMPKENALAPLSTASKKIMRHVIKTFLRYEFTIAQRVHDPNYDLANDLKNIGNKWLDMKNPIVGKTPIKTFYKMKQLHIFLETDISKIQDILKSIDFALSRRMIPYFKNMENEVVEEINRGLKSIINKAQMIEQFVYEDKKSTTPTIARMKDTNSAILNEVLNNKKKRSFLRHIRNLLKSSKKDTNELLQRQVPKSEIVKQLAKKKLDELAQKRYIEYEDAMRKWQKTLNVLPRLKRNVKDRMMNIIPKYLRHKLNPKITGQKKNTTQKLKNTGRKKKRHGHKNRKNLSTTVTPSKDNKIMKQKTTLKPKVKTTRSTSASSTLSVKRQVKKQ